MTKDYGGNINIISGANMKQRRFERLTAPQLIRNVPEFYGPQKLIITYGQMAEQGTHHTQPTNNHLYFMFV